MFSGVTLTSGDISAGITAFWGIAAVVAVVGSVMALRFIPKLTRAFYSLLGRR